AEAGVGTGEGIPETPFIAVGLLVLLWCCSKCGKTESFLEEVSLLPTYTPKRSRRSVLRTRVRSPCSVPSRPTMPAITLAAVLTTAAAVSAASLNCFVAANQQQRGAASHGRPPHRRRRHYQVNRQQQQRRRRQRPSAGGGVSCGSSAEEATSNAAPTQDEEDERNEEEEDCSSCYGEVAAAAAVPSRGVMAGGVPDDGRPESPASPAVFNDLVLILDAPALPPAPWKLPNLPEENDVSTCMYPVVCLDFGTIYFIVAFCTSVGFPLC
ncbi:unnamed protein product, partial [Ectocarpus sp. 12 AP-2014]